MPLTEANAAGEGPVCTEGEVRGEGPAGESARGDGSRGTAHGVPRERESSLWVQDWELVLGWELVLEQLQLQLQRPQALACSRAAGWRVR